ncbi:MAG: hypothetical protein EXS08_06725 [Planctomycetes bacterium]|nr:hypothetical protein [Planctomycetota bacterium]
MKPLAVLLALGVLAGLARGSIDSVTLKVSPSSNTVPGTVKATLRNQVISVGIPPMASASTKRDLIKAALAGAGYAVIDDGPIGSSLTILGLTKKDTVKFETSDTGEILDTLRHSTCGHGEVGYVNAHFDPFDSNLQPAIFSAGIVTDVGQLSVQVSAQELNFQTDGPIICQALFQRLAPRAPQYGAQINYAGDRLEVYFDPAYTVTQGGILFGTTSPTPGCAGSVESRELRESLELKLGDSTNLLPELLRIVIAGEDGQTTDAQVPPFTPAPSLRSILLNALQADGLPAFADFDPSTLKIVDLSPKSIVTVRPRQTGQAELELWGPHVQGGRVLFTDVFVPFDSGGQPALFTGGIVTDVGILREQISAADLNFQTDGPIICQALFQRLAPRAPQYGAQINYAGDRLEVYFDPAYTVTQGGVIFGTTSPSPGSAGSILYFDRLKRH